MPGSLLVFLQELQGQDYPYRVGITHSDDEGHSQATSGFISDDPFTAVVGMQSGTGIIRRPGIAIIECNSDFTGRNDEVESTAGAAAIYVKVE